MKRVAVGLAAAISLAAQPQRWTPTCAPVGRTQLLPGVPEASGVAWSGGVLWTHNDSGAVLFRIDPDGRTLPIKVSGATNVDWEDIAAGKCAEADCLYIADIGDNRSVRKRITIYQVDMPARDGTSTVPARAYHATYPDSPHDAEALLITRQATFIITKDVPPRVYQFQQALQPGGTARLSLLRILKETVRVTGAAAAPDGRWVALRSNRMLFLYRNDDFVKGGDPVRIDLSALKEPQGEGVAFERGVEIALVSEGRGKGAAGLLTRVRCAFME